MSIISIIVPDGFNITEDNLWEWYCMQLAEGTTLRIVENDIDRFINDLCMFDGQQHISKAELYSMYTVWTVLDTTPTYDKFNRVMRLYPINDYRPLIDGRRVRCWRGIGLKRG